MHADRMGGIVALVIYGARIPVFCFRLWGKAEQAQWAGMVWLITALPPGYLLATATGLGRPPLCFV